MSRLKKITASALPRIPRMQMYPKFVQAFGSVENTSKKPELKLYAIVKGAALAKLSVVTVSAFK